MVPVALAVIMMGKFLLFQKDGFVRADNSYGSLCLLL